MSEAETTPIDKAHEAPIRDEIRGLRGSIDGMQRSIGPLFDALAERLLHRLALDREEDRKRTDALLRHERSVRRRADRRLARTSASEVARLDGRIDALDLLIGKHFRLRESVTDEITVQVKHATERVAALDEAHKETRSRVDRVVEWADKHKGKLGVGVGGTGFGLALASTAPHWGDWLSAAWKWIVQ